MRRELGDLRSGGERRSPRAPHLPRHANADGAPSADEGTELAPALAFFLRRQGCAADLRLDAPSR
jgi:hypothetical protein